MKSKGKSVISVCVYVCLVVCICVCVWLYCVVCVQQNHCVRAWKKESEWKTEK